MEDWEGWFLNVPITFLYESGNLNKFEKKRAYYKEELFKE